MAANDTVNYVQPLRALKATTALAPTSAPAILAAVALTVVEAITAAESASDDLRAIMRRIVDVAGILVPALSRPEAEADVALTESIKRVISSLEYLGVAVQKRLSKGKLYNFISASSSKVAIKQAQRDVEIALEEAEMCIRLANLRISERDRTMDLLVIKRAFNKAQQLQLAAIQDEVNRREEVRRRFAPQVLPIASAIFSGREKELVQGLSLFEQQEKVSIAILGPGGIGKTSLALSLIHHDKLVKKFEHRRYFIACDAVQTVDGLNERFETILGLKRGKPLLDLRRIVDEVRQPVLVTLDNLETPWEPKDSRSEIETFLSELAAIPMVSLVVTLRGAERPAGIAWTRPFLPPIAPLDLASAIEVFTSIADIPSDDPHMVQLILAVDLIPLAITLIAHQAQYASCQRLFEAWGKQKTKMVSRGAPYDGGKLSSLDVSIRVSLDSPRFKQEPDALRLLQLLSILPEGAQIGFLASMTGTGFSLDAAIVTLLRVSLATQDGGGTVKALSPIREHICSHFPISKDDLQTGFNYLKKETDSWRRCWGTEESANIHKRWVAQSSNILSFAREAISRPQDINPSASTRMSTNLFSLFYGHTATQPLDHLLEQAYETASAVARQATPAVPYLVAIQAILRLSYVTVGTDIDNIQTLESLVQVVREHGDPQMLGAALNNAAGIAGFEINAPHKVIAYAREIMQLDVMEISLKTLVDACSMTVILQWIGQTIMARDMLLSIKSTAESKGVDSRSKVEIESALAGFDEIRGFYSQGRRRLYSLLQTTELDRPTATNLHQMMSIACCQGRLDEAEKAGALSYQIFYNLGLAVERAGLTLLQLSTLYLAQGRHQDALNTCIQYQETFYNQESKLRTLEILKLSLDPTLRLNPSLESLQVVNQKGFFDRGELLYLLGRMQSAFRVFIVSLIMECTAGYRLGVSMLFLRVGDYFRISEQDMATAECCYRASLQTIEFIGTPIHQADALARISLCQEYHGHLDTAAITLSRARARLTQAGLTHQIDILDRKAQSVGLADKQSLCSFDAIHLPTQIGSWHCVPF